MGGFFLNPIQTQIIHIMKNFKQKQMNKYNVKSIICANVMMCICVC